MFSITLRRTLWACDRIITRDIRNRRLGPANPGLDNRIKAFKREGLKVHDDDAEEFIEQSASDFHNVHEEYNELMNETLIGKHKLRHHIIKEKYFKENMPNLLTWSEKEQIRHLLQTNPQEWTLERIAESFPVTIPVIKKLIKYPWKPSTEERIARHDASALRNWRELKEGSFDIPEELRQKLLKFSDRKIPPLKSTSIKKLDVTPQRMGEYEQIIRKCASKSEWKVAPEPPKQETLFRNKQTKAEKDKNRTTLEDLTAKIQKRLDSGKEINMPDQIILDSMNYKVSEDQNMINKVMLSTDDTHKLTEFKTEDPNIIKPITYPERIRIPKKAYKRDATYKVNDCFYDHDGKFLYRVIGMEN